MKRLEAREVQWFRGEYREKRYSGARRGKGKNRYVIWLLFLLTFTLVLPSVFVCAETGQITAKDKYKSSTRYSENRPAIRHHRHYPDRYHAKSPR